MIKKCKICGNEFPARGPKKTCSDSCSLENRRLYNRQNNCHYKEVHDAWEKRNPTYYIDRNKRIKDTVFNHYGGYKCACCGETEQLFLAIDHIDGGGSEHRRKIGSVGGGGFYSWLIKNNFPEGFQVLCHNCNWGKEHNKGVCPHQQKAKEAN